MAEPVFTIPYSVFLPGEMVVSQQDIDYQLAHANDFNCVGLNTFTITMMCIVTVAVILRLYARKTAKIELKSDDYTLILGWVGLSRLIRRPTQVHCNWHVHETNLLHSSDPVNRSTSLLPQRHLQWGLLPSYLSELPQ